jgi:predicted exporter
MLVGTIAYVLIFLPHQTGLPERAATTATETEGTLSDELLPPAPLKSRRRRRLERCAAVLFIGATLYLGYRSLSVRFDSDMHHINYMTEEQQRDLAAFADLQDQARGVTVYVAATDTSWEGALSRMEQLRPHLDSLQEAGSVLAIRSVDDFLPSRTEQERRLERWTAFWTEARRTEAERLITTEAIAAGFRPEAFAPFAENLEELTEAAKDRTLLASWNDLQPLAAGAFSGYLDSDTTRCTVVTQLQVETDRAADVEQELQTAHPDLFAFDMPRVNSAIADTLSDEFNYIGWACGLIVFLFLWGSFGRLELAVLAFLPMAVSWLWILGIMEFLDLRFNIVNVILATFIFGQGDDYTIFITEGLMYEYTYRHRLLKSYKKSILLSALIMFIGIGSLIVARHPALHSLAEVTIVGMSAVILSAWIIPPVVFHLLVRHADGTERDVAWTLRQWLRPGRRPEHPRTAAECQDYIRAKYRYRGREVERRAARFFRDETELIRTIEQMHVTPGIPSLVIHDPGQGEAALLAALLHPDLEVVAVIADAEARALAEGLSCRPENLRFAKP